MARKNGNGSSPRTTLKSSNKLSPHDKIAQRAYEIYLQRNGAPGDPLQDWLRAEQELAVKPKRATKKTVAATA